MKEIKSSENMLKSIESLQGRLERIHGVPTDEVISSERHALAMNLFEKSATIVHPPGRDIRITI
jgi:hypothetical protein